MKLVTNSSTKRVKLRDLKPGQVGVAPDGAVLHRLPENWEASNQQTYAVDLTNDADPQWYSDDTLVNVFPVGTKLTFEVTK